MSEYNTDEPLEVAIEATEKLLDILNELENEQVMAASLNVLSLKADNSIKKVTLEVTTRADIQL